jgi:hypothetical protein
VLPSLVLALHVVVRAVVRDLNDFIDHLVLADFARGVLRTDEVFDENPQ